MSPSTPSRDPSPTPSRLPPIPSSPSYSYASTTNPLSSYNLPLPPPPRAYHAVLTKNDLELSQTAYSELLSTAKQYRLALAELSKAAGYFGSALESCARLKEARSEALNLSGSNLANSFTAHESCTADSLMAASGVHQLIANHQQILSETVYRNFEVPLLHELDAWRRRMEEEELTYIRAVKDRSKEIRRMEKEGLKLHRQRKRDVGKFRSHLVDLTAKLDDLTSLHGGHSRTLLRDSQEASAKIVEASSSLVRAEVDIFESLARKGWSGGGLDELLDKGVDLFANELDSVGGDNPKLFSILPQKSILADSTGERPDHPPHRRSDSLLVEGNSYQSLAGAVSSHQRGGGEEDTGSIFSERTGIPEGNFNKSRGVRPFSPPPVLRRLECADPVAATSTILPLAEDSPAVLALAQELPEDEEDSRTIKPVSTPASEKGEKGFGSEAASESRPNSRFGSGSVSGGELGIESAGYGVAGSTSGSRPGSKSGSGELSLRERGRERRWSVTDDSTLSE
jgi:hypothetical protein